MLFGSPQHNLGPRLNAVERKLDLLLSHLGISLPEDDHHRVRELVQAGKKIEAIKLYREQTGSSLFDAKAAVDAM